MSKKPEKVGMEVTQSDYKEGSEQIAKAGGWAYDKAKEEDLVGQGREKVRIARGGERLVEAPFPMECAGEGSCSAKYGYGAKVFNKRGRLLCPTCGGQLERLEFK